MKPMLFSFLIVMIEDCVAFRLKCPEPAHWSFRAKGHCPDPSKYFCLKNDLINGYSENCTVFDFQQPGRKGVLRGGMDADTCSKERYQPWPITFYTNVSTNCIFSKSKCNEEGQMVYGNGDRNTDTSCKCDYTRGYDFLIKPRNQCFCVPSVEDCSCFLKSCLNSTYILSPDSECILEKINLSGTYCNTMVRERVNRKGNHSHTNWISRKENISSQAKLKIYIGICVSAICLGVFLVPCVYKLCATYGRKGVFLVPCVYKLCETCGRKEHYSTDLSVNNTNRTKSDSTVNGCEELDTNFEERDMEVLTDNQTRQNIENHVIIYQRKDHNSLDKDSFTKNETCEYQMDFNAIEKEIQLNSNENEGCKICYECENMSAMYRCYDCSRINLCKECFRKIHNDRNVHESFQPISDSYILDCKFKLPDKSTSIKDIQILNNGLLVVATNAQHNRILTCSIHGMDMKSIPITGWPERITEMEGNYVAVLLAEYGKVNIGIVDIKKRCVKKYIQGTQCSWNIRSAFIYIENQFYISDFEKINVLDQTGILRKQIPCSTPVDICCDFDLLRIYFINELSNKMFFVDIEGSNTPTCTDHNLKDPKSMTTYDKEYMLILCRNENAMYNVIKVDYNGQSSETVMTNIRIPNCRPNICFTRLTNSLVIWLMGTVYIYKTE